MQRIIVNLVTAGKLTLDDAAEQLDSSSDEIQKVIDASKDEANVMDDSKK